MYSFCLMTEFNKAPPKFSLIIAIAKSSFKLSFVADLGDQLNGRIDPLASLPTIGVAIVALMVLMVLLPMNVRGRRNSTRTSDQANKQNANKHRDDDHHDRDNGPDLAT